MSPGPPVLGTPNAGITGATSYTWPTHQADDILLLALESSVSALSTPTAPMGMAHTVNSPRPQSTNATAITAFWKRATSSAESDATVPAAADHQVGMPLRIRGGLTSGNPWDVSIASGQSVGTGTRTLGGITTLTADSLVVYMIACDLDSLVDNFSTFNTPSGLTGFTVFTRTFTDNGNGGGLAVAYGTKVTAGFVGSFTWSFTNAAAWSGIALALPPAGSATAINFEGWGVSL